MAPNNSNQPNNIRSTNGQTKQGTGTMNKVKMLVAAGAVAGALGGWGMVAHQNTSAQPASAAAFAETSTPGMTATTTAGTAATATPASTAKSTTTPTAQATAAATASATMTSTATAAVAPETPTT